MLLRAGLSAIPRKSSSFFAITKPRQNPVAVVDMVGESIDVSIRVGWLHDSNLIARKLGDWPRFLCASPDYIEQNGRPESPTQLTDHEWIIFTRLPTHQRSIEKQ